MKEYTPYKSSDDACKHVSRNLSPVTHDKKCVKEPVPGDTLKEGGQLVAGGEWIGDMKDREAKGGSGVRVFFAVVQEDGLFGTEIVFRAEGVKDGRVGLNHLELVGDYTAVGVRKKVKTLHVLEEHPLRVVGEKIDVVALLL